MPLRSSTSSEPKPLMVPWKARTSFSTAFELLPKLSVWVVSTAACRVSVALLPMPSVPVPSTAP